MKNSTNQLPTHMIVKNNGLIIMGAPRSGLSVLANSLRLLGMDTGGQKAAIVTGPALIYQLFCQDLGVSPMMVGHLPEGWQDSTAAKEAKQRIRKLLIALETTGQPWMLADPFLCLFFPLWQEIFGELGLKPKFIHLLRHPWETAQSLAHTEQIDLSTGHLIWLQCNREAIGVRANYPYMLATFDQLLADPVSLLINANETLTLDYPLDLRTVYQELLNLTRPGTKRFYANSATKKEQEAFGPFLRVHTELRSLQASVSVLGETIQPKWDMLDFVLGTIGQHQGVEYKQVASFSERQEADDMPEMPLKANFYFPSCYDKGEIVETIPLITNEWQKISIQVPESNRTIKKRLKFSPLNTNGVFWMSSLTFVNRITGEELCTYQGGKEFNQFDLEGTLVRIDNPDNMLLLITGKSALLVLPGIEHLPDCPMELVLWVRATRDQTVVREHLIGEQQKQELKYLYRIQKENALFLYTDPQIQKTVVPSVSTFAGKHASEMMRKDLHIRVNEKLIDRERNKLPKEDFTSELFDTKELFHTTNILVLFSTPRSGSTLLCNLLMKNKICLAHEYFQPYQYMPILAKRWQCILNGELNISKYVRSLCDQRTLENGWLGINLHGTHIEIFQHFRDYFPPCNIHYIHLVRKNIIDQAISYVIAQQTGKWSSHFQAVNEPQYDFNAINWKLKDIVEANKLIESYMSTLGIDCQKVFYEDLIEDPQLFFSSISNIMPESLSIKFDTSLTKQASALSAEWRDMYQSKLCQVGKTNKIGLIEIIPKAIGSVMQEVSPNNSKIKAEVNCETYLPGNELGVVFAPDWSARNPYQKLLYRALRTVYDVSVTGLSVKCLNKDNLRKLRSSHSVLHLHWEHPFYDPTDKSSVERFVELLENAKQLGYRVFWTMHNMLPHDIKDSTESLAHLTVQRQIGRLADAVIIHGESPEIKQSLVRELGISSAKIYNISHGTYDNYYPNHVSIQIAKNRLAVSDSTFVILFFGNIKDYKGIDALLECYARIKKDESTAILLIAGRIFNDEIKTSLQLAADSDPNIRLHMDWIEEEEVQYYFRAADIVMLPYKEILTSGVAVLAMTFGTPVIAPRKGVLDEYVTSQYGFLFDDYDHIYKLTKNYLISTQDGKNNNNMKREVSQASPHLAWPLLVHNAPFSEIFKKKRVEQVSNSQIINKETTFALIRVIGGNLTPLHSSTQNLENLRLILDHEPSFPGCTKAWVINRIEDEQNRRDIKKMLEEKGQLYIEIPFETDVYSEIDFDYTRLPQQDCLSAKKYRNETKFEVSRYKCAIIDKKNQYVMNNNGARNAALNYGKEFGVDWVLPWDGNCFLSETAWSELRSAAMAATYEKNIIVPMIRLLDNSVLSGSLDHAKFDKSEEPQICFRSNSSESFNEHFVYGFKPKVELLQRLGVPGKWDSWGYEPYPWEKNREVSISAEANLFRWSSSVFRLSSGNQKSSISAENRAATRQVAICKKIQGVDYKHLFSSYNKRNLTLYSRSFLAKLSNNTLESDSDGNWNLLRIELLQLADTYLETPALTVTNKSTLPPSGNIQDYWHPAPYAWPNPDTTDGMPYIHKDGLRVPGTRLYETESNKYDRTSLQKLFDETTVLSIAWMVKGDARYAIKAVEHLRSWFINKGTRMNPHLRYSQVVRGKNSDLGTASGLIETKDFYFMLDAIRILCDSPYCTQDDEDGIRVWFKEFLEWLLNSEQGKTEVRATNNHGVAFDLQVFSIASFLGDTDTMYETLIRAGGRLQTHFERSGLQPHEMKRTTTAHYTAFNLQLWLNLSMVVSNTIGYSFLKTQRPYTNDNKLVELNPIKLGLQWLLPYYNKQWPFKQIDDFNKERLAVLYHLSKNDVPFLRKEFESIFPSISDCNPNFFPHDGIPVFWLLNSDNFLNKTINRM